MYEGLERRIIDLGDARIACAVAGSGPPVDQFPGETGKVLKEFLDAQP
jgi:hypothetical protein